MAPYVGMAKRRHGASGCSFGEKFSQWLAREGTNIKAFAERNGLKQRTLHGWVKEGVRVPAAGLATIVKATGIPADYWTNEALPWPPATDYYAELLPRLISAAKALPAERLREIVEMSESESDVEMTLALRRAARRGRPG